MYEIGNERPISLKMETYEQKQCCSHCTLNRKGLKSVAWSKYKLARLSYLCAAMSLFISIMAFWMCYRLQTRCAADDDIDHLHSVIKQLSQEITLLQNNQIKAKSDNLINSESGNVDASYFDNEHIIKDESLQGFQRNQTEPTILSQNELQQQMHKIVKRSKNNKKHRRQRNNRRRRRHHESPTYAVLRGGGIHNSSTGIFEWTTPNNSRTWISPNMIEWASREKLGAPFSGLYSIKIQITVKGRTDDDPVFRPVGMWICEEITHINGSTDTKILDRVYITQDDGGEIRQVRGGQAEDAPVDILTYTNVIYLQHRHKIFVKIPTEHRNDHTIQYDNSADSAHFSMHLVYAN